MVRIAIFASSNGSNAENLINHFAGSPSVEVSLIVSNRVDAFVLERAARLGVESRYVPKSEFYSEDIFLPLLDDYKIDFIVLAGFLLKCPTFLLDKYPNRILNIHPSLLPKFGGKGMYGEHVHKAVLEAGESVSGITIHTIDDRYDCGTIIHQSECKVDSGETPLSLAAKIHELEKVYPQVVENYIGKMFNN